MTLKLDGKPFVKNKPSPGQQKILDFLNKSGDNEIFSRAELINRGMSLEALNKNPVIWEPVSRLWQHRRYFGSPKAMAAFDKEVGK